jgi:hypothetical protein
VDHVEPIPFPHASDPTDEDLDDALAEVDAAIALVTGGGAVRVRMIGFALAEAVAGLAAAHAQIAGVGFQIDRPDVAGAAAMIIGPIV